MRRAAAAMLAVVVLALALPDRAQACSCGLASACNLYNNADVIFVGTAVSEDASTGRVRFHIEEAFHGVSGNFVEVHHYNPIQCDSFAFQVGRKYLVVAYRQQVYHTTYWGRIRDRLGSWFPSLQPPPELTAGICNQGVGAEFAAGDIRVLRERAAGKPLPSVYGAVVLEDGRPAANIPVRIRDDKGHERETRTASDGSFEFFDLPRRFEEVTATLPDGGTVSDFAWGDNQHCRRAYLVQRKPST